MKTNIAVLSFLICIVMVTTAVKAADFNDVNLPPNGNFEGGTYAANWGRHFPSGWNWWHNLMGGYGNPTSNAEMNYIDSNVVTVTMDTTQASALGNNHGYVSIWQTPTLNLTTLGIPEPVDIFIAVDINDLIPGGGLPIAVISNKCLDNSQNNTAGPNTLVNLSYQILDTNAYVGWTTYRFSFPMPAGTKAIQPHFGVDYPSGPNTGPPSKFAFDNFRIGKLDGFTPALCPIPIIGGAENLPNNVISWSNPQGAINADVYLQETLAPDEYAYPRTTGTLIAHNTTAQSLTVPSMQVNRYYYWTVDVNMGSYVVQGYTWDFHTTNLHVEAGPTQYLVRASPKTLILNATVTSDNAIATYAWTNITLAANKDPYTTVAIVTPTTEDTNVTLTNTEPNHTVDGWYQFTLTVTDVQGNIAADTVNVGVYSTCAAAAIADPNDNYTGAGDLNGDCKVDLYDFAVIANNWLDCDSLRRSCL